MTVTLTFEKFCQQYGDTRRVMSLQKALPIRPRCGERWRAMSGVGVKGGKEMVRAWQAKVELVMV